MNHGFKCYGIRTDSVLTDATEEQLKTFIEFNNKIGGFKIERNKLLCNKDIEFEHNEFKVINDVKPNIIYIKSEDDFLTIMSHITMRLKMY